jgi:hypothetical protein
MPKHYHRMRLRATQSCAGCDDELQPPDTVVFDLDNGDVYCTFCAVDLEELDELEAKAKAKAQERSAA